jgi:hypothetical protein
MLALLGLVLLTASSRALPRPAGLPAFVSVTHEDAASGPERAPLSTEAGEAPGAVTGVPPPRETPPQDD